MPLNSSRTRMQRLDALEPRLAVDIRERADVQVAVQRGECHRAAGVFADPRLVVFPLTRAASSMRESRLPCPSPW